MLDFHFPDTLLTNTDCPPAVEPCGEVSFADETVIVNDEDQNVEPEETEPGDVLEFLGNNASGDKIGL